MRFEFQSAGAPQQSLRASRQPKRAFGAGLRLSRLDGRRSLLAGVSSHRMPHRDRAVALRQQTGRETCREQAMFASFGNKSLLFFAFSTRISTQQLCTATADSLAHESSRVGTGGVGLCRGASERSAFAIKIGSETQSDLISKSKNLPGGNVCALPGSVEPRLCQGLTERIHQEFCRNTTGYSR
jgi:hypothetical protein